MFGGLWREIYVFFSKLISHLAVGQIRNFHILGDMTSAIEYSFNQLDELSKKGQYDRSRICKHMKVTCFAWMREKLHRQTLMLTL